MQEDIEGFTTENYLLGSEKRKIEGLFDPIRFDALFDFASTLLVSKPIEYVPDPTPLSTEAQIVQKLGTRGLRTAYELVNGVEFFPSDTEGTIEKSSYQDSLTPSTQLFMADIEAPLLFPQLFSGELDRDAIAKTELLGEAMMDDMFKILGQDAYLMADRMKNAKTALEQVKVFKWLENRINTIKAAFEDPNAENIEQFYTAPKDMTEGFIFHPVRLSGKIIGTYPNHRIGPTCLGSSIAAAGFFKRAGIETLHAGVMETRSNTRHDRAVEFIDKLPRLVDERFGIVFPDAFLKRNEEGISHIMSGLLTDIGYHHCLYIKLKDDTWMQFDSSFGKSVPLNFADTNEKLSSTYDFLKEMHEVSPGLEITQELESFKSLSSWFESLVPTINNECLITQDEAKSFLRALDPSTESIPTQLYEQFVTPAFAADAITNEAGKKSLKIILKFFENEANYGVVPKLYEMACTVLEKYVLDDMAIDAYIIRCKHDATFLERAANDLRALPFMTMAASVINLLDLDQIDYGINPYVEIGLPAARIGFAALSDVAEFYDTAPSPSFWLSNWPSLQPVTEAFYLDSTSPSQKAILLNNLQALHARDLRYTVSYGKVQNIQSDATDSKENQDGQEAQPAGDR